MIERAGDVLVQTANVVDGFVGEGRPRGVDASRDADDDRTMVADALESVGVLDQLRDLAGRRFRDGAATQGRQVGEDFPLQFVDLAFYLEGLVDHLPQVFAGVGDDVERVGEHVSHEAGHVLHGFADLDDIELCASDHGRGDVAPTIAWFGRGGRDPSRDDLLELLCEREHHQGVGDVE